MLYRWNARTPNVGRLLAVVDPAADDDRIGHFLERAAGIEAAALETMESLGLAETKPAHEDALGAPDELARLGVRTEAACFLLQSGNAGELGARRLNGGLEIGLTEGLGEESVD